MGRNFTKIIIFGVILIIISAGGVLAYNYFNQDHSSTTPFTQQEKDDIYEALTSGDPSLYQKYLLDGEKMSFAFKDGTTPLEKLIEASDILSAQELLQNGFDLTKVENNHIDSISNIMVYGKNFDISSINLITTELIAQIKDEIDEEDSSGYSLLMNSIYTNNTTITSEVLKYSDDVNKTYNGETALTFACQLGVNNLDIIKDLVEKGANINFKGDEGYNCLMNAIYNNQNEVVKYLVNLENLNINDKNDSGQTALHLCVEYSNLDAIDIILQNPNVDKTIEDNDGFTAKEYADYLKMNDFSVKLQ